MVVRSVLLMWNAHKSVGLLAAFALVAALAACRPGVETAGVTASGSTANASQFALGGDNAPVEQPSSRLKKIENPTVADIMKPGPLPEMALGSEGAPVTVIEYASLTCPHCRAFHEQTWPAFKREYVDTGKVRYILREFPIGRSSGNAWLVTRCAGGAMSHKLFDIYLRKQAAWVSQDVRVEKIFAIANQAGMSRAQFDACLKDEKVIEAIKWTKERGRQLGVIGTPTFFINGKQPRSVPSIAEMRNLVDPLLQRTVATTSG